MIIEKPQTAVPNQDGSIRLYFEFDDNALFYPQADFEIRGGICWPITYRVDGAIDSEGYAIVAGRNLNNGIITIFEQTGFMVTEPIINKRSGAIDFPGLSNFINNAFANYFCNRYYWHQNFELSKRWRLEVSRSQMINPKPRLIEIPWGEDRDADHVIWSAFKQKKLRFDPDSKLKAQLEQIKKTDKSKDIYPAVRALQCALMGMQRFPLRRREEQGVF